MRRRELLATTGTAATGSIAGCMNPFAEEGIWIKDILVEFRSQESPLFRVEVDRDGEEILGRWFEFDGNNVVWVEGTWDSNPATYTVRLVGRNLEYPEGIATYTLTRDSLNDHMSLGDLRELECVILRVDARRDRLHLELRDLDLYDRSCSDA